MPCKRLLNACALTETPCAVPQELPPQRTQDAVQKAYLHQREVDLVATYDSQFHEVFVRSCNAALS